MKCRSVKKCLSAFSDGRLPATERDELALHLEQCANCSEEQQALEQLRARLARLPAAQPPTNLAAQLAARAMAEPERLDGSGIFAFQRIALPAMGLSLAVAFLLLVLGPSEAQIEGESQAASDLVELAVGYDQLQPGTYLMVGEEQ